MAEAVSNVVVSVGAGAGDGLEAALDLNHGFLGTGASTMVEISYIAMLMIVVYIAHGALRYYVPGFSLSATIFGVLGLRD